MTPSIVVDSSTRQSPVEEYPFLFMTAVQDLLCETFFRAYDILEDGGQLRVQVYDHVVGTITQVIRLLLPAAAQQFQYRFEPTPGLPFWAGVAVWKMVLAYYNVEQPKVCFNILREIWHFRPFFLLTGFYFPSLPNYLFPSACYYSLRCIRPPKSWATNARSNHNSSCISNKRTKKSTALQPTYGDN